MNEPEGDNVGSVKREADPACPICRGEGWYWGWDVRGYAPGQRLGALPPVRLRCPCVDQARRANE